MTAESINFPRLRFAIDRGGTFTDVICTIRFADGSTSVDSCKLLSVNPGQYPDAPSEGIRRLLQRHVLPAEDQCDDSRISTLNIDEIRMGTTVATNALLEHNGAPSVLVVTRGFEDILDIRDQARPAIFSLNVTKPKPLPELVVEAHERVRVTVRRPSGDESVSEHTTGYNTEVLEALDMAHIEARLQDAITSHGVRSIGVCLMHSYAFPDHEKQIGEVAARLGFTNISLSHQLTGMVKLVPRATTTAVDAYLTPLIRTYIDQFKRRFERDLGGVKLLFIQSDGGLVDADSFVGFKAVLSGPAGGVVGCARTSARVMGDVPVLGFDMGGTSTDVSRCAGGVVEHVLTAEIGGTVVQAPQVEVHTVAAGGGSILSWQHGMFVVGPDSAGAFPGPACYGRGGPLTVTDANVVLGRISVSRFPRIFGPNGDEPLQKAVSLQLFEELTAVINKDIKGAALLTVYDVAQSFVRVANETMCRPMRLLTEAKGLRADSHVLCVFGGAGGQHACGIADALGIQRVFLHRFSSYLSALGISLSEVSVDDVFSCSLCFADAGNVVNRSSMSVIVERASGMKRKLIATLDQKHGSASRGTCTTTKVEVALSMRFEGTNTGISTPLSLALLDSCGELPQDELDAVINVFKSQYQRQFGFLLHRRSILVDEIWVRASRGSQDAHFQNLSRGAELDAIFRGEIVEAKQLTDAPGEPVYFEGRGWVHTPQLGVTSTGCEGFEGNTLLQGPLILCGDGSTIVVEPGALAFVTANGDVIVDLSGDENQQHRVPISEALHPLPLSIFSHRFMSIAEQMGRTLQRTAISTNIKERLDFSCAIFDPDGSLVANAPHIPVHLGAMGSAVKWQRDYYATQCVGWRPGDVFLSNHPVAGGSHLPDITVMSACFDDSGTHVLFYVASRGHHADVGGTTPGSMPPFSTSLVEEGAAIKTLRLVVDGVFQEEQAREALLSPGISGVPGISGCRTIEDSISDLKAQVAANQRGVQLVRSLVEEFGLGVVQAYMRHIQRGAENAAREVLRSVATKYGPKLSATDLMDDGSDITLEIDIDPDTGSAVFDFSKGTSPQVFASTNCPTAVVYSAVIYCIRCLVGSDIPLNQGCLAPITVLTAPRSILCPDESCAVVAGNVLTSQRVTDVIFAALRAVACSQGCMNNFLFGDARSAYYETICGGTGAGSTFDGASCVQCHMTNTRITDPEILECRYDVLLVEFSRRRGSGGSGAHHGGDGCNRIVMFLSDSLTVTILSERRVLEPRGLAGGGSGARGRNLLIQSTTSSSELRELWSSAVDHSSVWRCGAAPSTLGAAARRVINVGGKNTFRVKCGDIMCIQTPGGGGFGVAMSPV